ncbi:uncharacterized protein LOC115886881 [Sitophilus oryzae]|uniref:Uncharacterized protein LOC115886881 n=1 Tax=Sitophilus oryzae TaxID=7048 RepID=A0A6J2YDU2_SITOR|nr:uncharacterized protein LOC115886881 [Sitophilus oryzae]
MKSIVFLGLIALAAASGQFEEYQKNQYQGQKVFGNADNNFSQAVYQAEQAYQYAVAAQKVLATSNLPATVYQYVSQQLGEGIANARVAKEFFQAYQQQYYQQYFVEIASNRIQQALQYFQRAYQYINDQQVQGTFTQNIENFEQPIQNAVQAAQNAYTLSQQFVSGSQGTFQGFQQGFQYQNEENYGFQYVKNQFQQIEKLVATAQEAVEQNGPFENASYIVEYLKKGLQYIQNISEKVQQGQFYNSPSFVFQQAKQAYQAFYNAYQAARKQGQRTVAQQINLLQQPVQNVVRAIQQNYSNNVQFASPSVQPVQQYAYPTYGGYPNQYNGPYSAGYPYTTYGSYGFESYVPVNYPSAAAYPNVYSNVPASSQYGYFSKHAYPFTGPSYQNYEGNAPYVA